MKKPPKGYKIETNGKEFRFVRPDGSRGVSRITYEDARAAAEHHAEQDKWEEVK